MKKVDNYDGVYCTVLKDGTKTYYVRWWDEKLKQQFTVKAGRESRGMTPAKAHRDLKKYLRGELIHQHVTKKEQDKIWPLNRIFQRYCSQVDVPKAIKADKDRWNFHIKSRWGNIVPADVDEDTVEQYKRELIGAGRKPKTINNIIELLHRIARWGTQHIKVDGEYIAGFPFPIRLIKNINNERIITLSLQQRDNLIKAAHEYRDPMVGNLALFLYYSGTRRGEAFDLLWSDVHIDGIDTPHVILRDTKSGGIQELPLLHDAVELLREHIQYRRDDTDLVFYSSASGKRWYDCRASMKSIFKVAGLPDDFVTHDLRHAFAQTQLENGMLMAELSQIFLRHSTVAITERRYARFSREGKYSVVERMNNRRLQ